MKDDYVNLKTYAKIAKVLAAVPTSEQELDKQLAELKSEGRKIFETDEDGKIVLHRRGRFMVPKIKFFYVATNLRKTFAFVAALYQYAIAVLRGEYDEFAANALANADEAEHNPKAIADDEKKATDMPEVLKEVVDATLPVDNNSGPASE